MTPTEVIKRIISLNICFQVKQGKHNTQGVKEDWSQAGFNAENVSDSDREREYYEQLQVITDHNKLYDYSNWILAQNAPENITKKFDGPVMSTFLDKKRRLTIRGDDIPFGGGGMTLKFSCEEITNIELNKGMLVITTIFGQTGVMIPKDGG